MKLKFTTKSHLVGKRVEIAPHYDLWMRGARCGVIHSIDALNGILRVRMDHPAVKRLARVFTTDVKFI